MKNKLKPRRAELGLIQLKVALKAGMTASRLSYIENELAEPDAGEIAALSRVLETTPKELFPGLAEQQGAEA